MSISRNTFFRAVHRQALCGGSGTRRFRFFENLLLSSPLTSCRRLSCRRSRPAPTSFLHGLTMLVSTGTPVVATRSTTRRKGTGEVLGRYWGGSQEVQEQFWGGGVEERREVLGGGVIFHSFMLRWCQQQKTLSPALVCDRAAAGSDPVQTGLPPIRGRFENTFHVLHLPQHRTPGPMPRTRAP